MVFPYKPKVQKKSRSRELEIDRVFASTPVFHNFLKVKVKYDNDNIELGHPRWSTGWIREREGLGLLRLSDTTTHYSTIVGKYEHFPVAIAWLNVRVARTR